MGAKSGEYVLGVPFMTGMGDVVVDELEFDVILPEGARSVVLLRSRRCCAKLIRGVSRRNVRVAAPFPLETAPLHFVQFTYLDSFGRQTVRIVKSRCVDKHGEGLVYVRPPSSHPFQG